jgi:CubicO group peptidase (beta-lactamase class C family)
MGTASEAGFRAEALARITARTAEWALSPNTPISVVLAARRGVMALHHANGVPGQPDGSPDEEPVFFCASMANPVTATAIMMLVEEGLLSLNRPLNEYDPGFRGQYADRIQVHHLLTHTSGILEEFVDGMPAWLASPRPETAPEPGQTADMHHLLAYFQSRDCFKKPGTQMIYANANYSILGELVRRVSGVRLREFVRTRIFAPLGMTASVIGWDAAILARWRPRPANFMTHELAREMDDDGAMALFSTARDVAAFCQMFLNGGTYGGQRILNEWTVQEMTRNQIPGVGCVDYSGHWVQEASWGLGWMVQGNARWSYSQGYLTPPRDVPAPGRGRDGHVGRPAARGGRRLPHDCATRHDDRQSQLRVRQVPEHGHGRGRPRRVGSPATLQSVLRKSRCRASTISMTARPGSRAAPRRAIRVDPARPLRTTVRSAL